MTDPFIGEIRAFGFDYAPLYWASCNGQTVPIRQAQALFSVITNTYGPYDDTTFTLPDLVGRAAVGVNTSTSSRLPTTLGATFGAVGVSLTSANMAAHTHAASAPAAGSSLAARPSAAAWPSVPRIGNTAYDAFTTTAPTTTLHPTAISSFGGNSQGVADAHPNLSPYLPLNFCIAFEGVYPYSD